MQESNWSFLSELLARLLAALFGSVAPGTPALQFEVPVSLPIAGGSVACAEGSFGVSRGDPALDVVCLTQGGLVSVTALDGSGAQRTTSSSLIFEQLEQTPVVHDFDGDGALDLVVLSQQYQVPCEIAGLRGDGAGGFSVASRQTVASPSNGPVRDCVGLGGADFDEDGSLDLVVLYRGSNYTQVSASVYLWRGDAGFELAGSVEAPIPEGLDPDRAERTASDPLVLDIDQDGHRDVVFAAGVTDDYYNRDVLLISLLGDGQGHLTPKHARTLGSQSGKYSMISADFDADGNVDLGLAPKVMYSEQSFPAVVAYGRGDGVFPTARLVGAASANGAIHAADYDGDGHTDLIAADVDGSVRVYAGAGDRTYEQRFGFRLGPSPLWLSTLDLANDGELELVAVTSEGIERLPLPRAEDALRLVEAPRVSSFETDQTSWANNTFVADMDGDADLDVLVDHFGIATYGNAGDGSFVPSQVVLPRKEQLLDLEAGDLNGDGLGDLVATDGLGIVVYLQNSAGSWASGVPLHSNDSFSESISGVQIADLNADGRQDIVQFSVRDYASRVWIIVQDESGGFSRNLPVDVSAEAFSVRDVNEDGRLDLIVQRAGQLSLLLGDGEGEFAPGDASDAMAGGFRAFEDMNLDGVPDLVTTSAVHLATAPGRYGPPLSYGPINYGQYVGIVDLNGDTFPDLVMANAGVSVHLGRGDGSLEDARQVYALGYSERVFIADCNADSLPDLVAVKVQGSSAGVSTQITAIQNISGSAVAAAP